MSDSIATELLNAMVPLLKIQPVFDDYCHFSGSWESPHAPSGRGWAQFHIVTKGFCLVERPGLGQLRLEAGDIFLLPHGDSHLVRSRRRGVPRPTSTYYRNGIRQRATPDAESETELLCGRLLFETLDYNPLVAALPDEIVIKTADAPLMERFRRLLTDIFDELDRGKTGSEVIAADFSRVLFVMMIRDHLTEHGKASTLCLLRDRTTARVVLALLNDPARDWTLDDMAAIGITSRATLVRAFSKLAGTAPMTFLSNLRLTMARQRLAGTSESIASIAAQVGYGSEGALSKAIMRKFGVRPSVLRLHGHGDVETPQVRRVSRPRAKAV